MFCQSGLPILAFLGCGALVVWLWNANGNGGGTMGEVYAPRADIVPQVAGEILSGPGYPVLEEFTEVRKGQVIAVLDSKALDARIRVLTAEAESLKASLDEILATAKYEDLRLTADYAANQLQASVDLIGVKTDLKVQYWKDWQEFRVAEIEYQRNKEIYEKYLPFSNLRWDEASKAIVKNEGRERDGQVVSDPQMIEAIKLMLVAQETYQAAKARYDMIAKEAKSLAEMSTSLPPPPKTDVEKQLAPVQKEMEAKLAEVDEIEAQKEFLKIRAPFDGVVSAVFARPGQVVQPSTIICTIAATKTEYVLAYIRQNSTLRPRVGMKAEVRFRGSNETVPGAIVKIGAHVEAVSLKQLFDPNMQEWGLPIAIRLNWPDERRMQELQPRPGEIVFVRVLPNEKDDTTVAAADDVPLGGASVVFAGK
ncbi:MAG: hypothetical protein DCC68_05710 [Planctomycetota bacterium]|nr:MAG: hypothetical protein DCC68_05710 [Planctomycetota bacterium]